jgi:hypothetical protein
MATFSYPGSTPDRAEIVRGLEDRGVIVSPDHHLSDEKLRALWQVCSRWGAGGAPAPPAAAAFSERARRAGARGPLSEERRKQLLNMTPHGRAVLGPGRTA